MRGKNVKDARNVRNREYGMTVKRKDIREIELELTGMCNLGCYICSRNFVHSIHTKRVNVRKL